MKDRNDRSGVHVMGLVGGRAGMGGKCAIDLRS